MSVAIRMRRVPPEDLNLGLRHIDAAFEATFDEAVYEAEIESGVLCSLDEDWNFAHVILTGQRHQIAGPSGLPVLGGVPLGLVGSEPEMLIGLSREEVAAAANFLRAADITALMDARRELLAEYVLGEIPDSFVAGIREDLKALRRFYELAADASQVVVKRIYN